MSTFKSAFVTALLSANTETVIEQFTKNKVQLGELKDIIKFIPELKRSLVDYVKSKEEEAKQEELKLIEEKRKADEEKRQIILSAHAALLKDLEEKGITVTDEIRNNIPGLPETKERKERKERKKTMLLVDGKQICLNGRPSKEVYELIEKSGLTREAFIEKYQVKEEA